LLAIVPTGDLHTGYVSVPLSAVARVSVLAGFLAPDAGFQPAVESLPFVGRFFARGSGVAVVAANFDALAGAPAPTPHHGCSSWDDRCGSGKHCLAGCHLDFSRAVFCPVVLRAADHRQYPTEIETPVETGVPAEPSCWIDHAG
jgi:hypothetical protein